MHITLAIERGKKEDKSIIFIIWNGWVEVHDKGIVKKNRSFRKNGLYSILTRVAQAVDANKARNFFLGCCVIIGNMNSQHLKSRPSRCKW